MGRLRLLGVAIALTPGVLSFGLVPAAAENPGKPTLPGQEKTPPGQAAKAEKADEQGKPEKATPPGHIDEETTEPAPAADEPEQADAGKAVADAEAPSSHSKPQKHAADPKPEHSEREHVHKPAKNETATHGNSSVAHLHAIICHRTGSTKNPYVVINISKSAWLHGHATHPALSGHNDILLKEGAAPGEKMPRGACGQQREVPTAPKPPPSDVLPKPKDDPNPADRPKASDPPVSVPAAAPPVIPPARPAGSADPASADGAAVAAEVEVLGVDELPFTGVPLWLAVFAGCLLLGTGLALRNASWSPEGGAQPVSTSTKKAETALR
jgi:hypothetical protein